MTYRQFPNWPPVWLWKDGLNKKILRGEIGILRMVTVSENQPDSCYLHIEHEGTLYVGCLLFDDDVFCGQIAKLLQRYLNRPIAEIGSLDLSHTL